MHKRGKGRKKQKKSPDSTEVDGGRKRRHDLMREHEFEVEEVIHIDIHKLRIVRKLISIQ